MYRTMPQQLRFFGGFFAVINESSLSSSSLVIIESLVSKSSEERAESGSSSRIPNCFLRLNRPKFRLLEITIDPTSILATITGSAQLGSFQAGEELQSGSSMGTVILKVAIVNSIYAFQLVPSLLFRALRYYEHTLLEK